MLAIPGNATVLFPGEKTEMVSDSLQASADRVVERRKVSPPHAWGFGSTPRTAVLRASLKWKAAVVKDYDNIFTGLAKSEFRGGQPIKVDVHRARLIT
jgi:hypothetical protein